eukprot:TRINITY_DN68678_c0_g1_i1.p1 TRINITY_DN68678_c0_g1~~TRINITY_DN68678_c0_g1_i1.p1  ORF type:complete len:101 (-),score=27.71 TRINITY_DN68678_c0_g1_i1:46-348(-)
MANINIKRDGKKVGDMWDISQIIEISLNANKDKQDPLAFMKFLILQRIQEKVACRPEGARFRSQEEYDEFFLTKVDRSKETRKIFMEMREEERRAALSQE